MNTVHCTGIRISRKDYRALPWTCREKTRAGNFVVSLGKFVPVIFID